MDFTGIILKDANLSSDFNNHKPLTKYEKMFEPIVDRRSNEELNLDPFQPNVVEEFNKKSKRFQKKTRLPLKTLKSISYSIRSHKSIENIYEVIHRYKK